MIEPRIRWTLAAAVAAQLCSPLLAQGPSFDCTTATGQVQTLICKDAGLSALRRPGWPEPGSAW